MHDDQKSNNAESNVPVCNEPTHHGRVHLFADFSEAFVVNVYLKRNEVIKLGIDSTFNGVVEYQVDDDEGQMRNDCRSKHKDENGGCFIVDGNANFPHEF